MTHCAFLASLQYTCLSTVGQQSSSWVSSWRLWVKTILPCADEHMPSAGQCQESLCLSSNHCRYLHVSLRLLDGLLHQALQTALERSALFNHQQGVVSVRRVPGNNIVISTC
ncbi:hypothetical protein JZ751_025655 [Albula glossodonta]|uniref:Secreted protein n=1 Tax=Albula glossodonta TaxID=121402 RepID=A0A8T2MY08_9TELE|nr:hypothetical protein JZ751_025655 [Albula glossodonta]